MKMNYFKRFFLLSFLFAFCFALPAQALAESATLEFEAQALDLDTGSVLDQEPGFADASEGADVRIGYHADRIPHAVLVPAGPGVELAVMSGWSYDSVTASDISDLAFSAEIIDQPLETGDTVLVRTDTGAVFKIGNAFENAQDATFSFSRLQ